MYILIHFTFSYGTRGHFVNNVQEWLKTDRYTKNCPHLLISKLVNAAQTRPSAVGSANALLLVMGCWSLSVRELSTNINNVVRSVVC